MSHELLRQVPLDHPAFAGHFPGQPILPGVVLLEWVVDALAAAGVSQGEGETLVFQNAKFLSPVSPGETLLLRLEPGARQGWRFEVLGTNTGEAGRSVASGSLSLSHE